MKKIILALFILNLTILSCKKKDQEPEPIPNPIPQEEVIVADETKIMDEETRNTISSIDTSNYTFTFSGSSAILDDLQIGDILVDGPSEMAHYGYLRKINQISSTKDGKTIYTEAAGLTQAVKQGSIDFHSGLLRGSQLERVVLTDGVSLKSIKGTDFTVFDLDYNMDVSEGININGHTSLSMDVFFKFDWSCSCMAVPPSIQIDTFASGVELNQSASINLVAEAAVGYEETISLASFYFEPWVFSVGPVPVVFIPMVEVIMDVNGQINAVFSTGASESFMGRIGIGYGPQNGWDGFAQQEFEFDYYPPVLELGLEVETHVGPEISLMLYGVVGPFANVMGCSKLEAQVAGGGENLWNLDYVVGAQAEVGLKIDVFIFDEEVSKDFCLFEHSLMHLEGESMENGIFWEYPIDGNWYGLGGDINLKAMYTGVTPTKVEFLLDGSLLATINEEPFEYLWSTQGVAYGEHQLKVIEYIGSQEEASDEIGISLLNAQWEIVDLSSLGINNESWNQDVYFSDANNGWIVGGDGYGFSGYLLHTTDGGANWQKTSPSDWFLRIDDLLFVNEDELLTTTADRRVYAAGAWDRQYGYFQGDDYIVTFNQLDIYGMAMNPNGFVEAIAYDYLDEKYYIAQANSSTHELTKLTPITYDYEGQGIAPSIHYRNNFGIVINLKDDSNPLRQFIMTTVDGGGSWESKQLNASGITREDDVKGVYFVNEDKGWIVGRESQGYAFVLITQDGGQSWEKVVKEDVDRFSDVFFLSDEEGYATVNTWNSNGIPSAKLYHSMDGGHTWEAVGLSERNFPLKKVVFKGPYIGYAVGWTAETLRFSVGK
ncbi:MAG: hypothetical protein B7C24_08335 [Bacteroidetes bacterium 4572_77]|nr:MAG: hypothetical protein B7C24_08335 [Bacteroidetes bacterium 4572_77]